MKKLFALLLAVIMIMGLATTAFATDISFTGGAPGATYSAYRLLVASDGGDGKFAYTLNAKYTAILQTETGKTDQKDIIAYIEALDSDGIRDFADDVYAAIVAAGLAADYTTNDDNIEGAEQGYYLIAETALGNNGEGVAEDTWSLIMVDTVGKDTLTVVTKESYPTVDKEVKEVNDSTGVEHWTEYADNDIGDIIDFHITGTLSGQYEHYINYWYEIADTMCAGLTLLPDSLVVKVGGVDVTEDTNLAIVTTDHSFTVTGDLKKLDAARDDLAILHNTTVNVTYQCRLNENAEKGTNGNPNEVVIRYQRNPYTNENPDEPGETPIDTNIVFTYDSIVNKVDGSGNALAGAGFTLYKWYSESNAWVTVGTEITGVTTFEYLGLDAGIYKLEETTVPEGYNKIDPIEFEILPVYDTSKDPVKLTNLKVVDRDGDEITSFAITLDVDSSAVSTDIVNNPGAELPSTGGIGTTLFYVFGAILFLGAAVLLITKRRMAV